MTIDDDMNDMRLDSEETPPPEESGNRSFLIVAAILGGITILSLLCIVGYAMFYLPRSQQQREAQVATVDAQNTAVALAITRTSEAAAIPATPTMSEEQRNALEYEAVQGDTPASIAEKLGADLQELLRLNNLTNPDTPVSPGTIIFIPVGENLNGYQVEQGDTPASIAEKLGVDLQDLLRLNNLSSPDITLSPGITIIVPRAQVQATPTPLLAVPTDTPVPTVDPRTATVAALLTQAAIAQQTTVPTSTALPTTGFVEDVGIPGLLGMALLLVVVIFLARRLRSA
jgi:LysM repeat protein